jgi:hypothetical protein
MDPKRIYFLSTLGSEKCGFLKEAKGESIFKVNSIEL